MGFKMNVLDAVKILFFGAPGDRDKAVAVVERECRQFLEWYTGFARWKKRRKTVRLTQDLDTEGNNDLEDDDEGQSTDLDIYSDDITVRLTQDLDRERNNDQEDDDEGDSSSCALSAGHENNDLEDDEEGQSRNLDICSDDIDDAIQNLLVHALSRTAPGLSDAPQSEKSAMAFIRVAARNAFISLLRTKSRYPFISLDIKLEEGSAGVTEEVHAKASAHDALDYRILKGRTAETKPAVALPKEPLEAIVTEDNAELVLDDILQALREWVKKNELGAARDEVDPTEDYGKVKKSPIAFFCRAVENTFADLRKDAKVGFVEDFQRMLRLAFAFSSNEEEVKKECNKRGIALNKGREDRNYKKVRDMLYQRKHRLLTRLVDALLDAGLSKTEVENIISAFLFRDTDDTIEDV
jgi:DNA-directed RNA polymerase specialized sigma24 family protein